MKSIQRILFPIDLSEYSDRIVDCVIKFTHHFDAELHLLYVARAFGYFSTIYVETSMISTMENAVCEGALKGLKEFKDRYLADVPNVVSRIVSGYASKEIIEYCNTEDIDLIVMGTHGRSGLGKMVFGSVADQVLRTSRVPVTVVNPHYQEENK